MTEKSITAGGGIEEQEISKKQLRGRYVRENDGYKEGPSDSIEDRGKSKTRQEDSAIRVSDRKTDKEDKRQIDSIRERRGRQ